MSIKDQALIVSLTVGKAQMTKTDGKATNAAEQATNAHNAGQYRKDLYPKHLTQPIKAVETSARYYIERTTYAWGRGEYLLPTARFMEFAEQIEKFKLQFDQSVTAFLQNWINVLDQARQQQGDLFNELDYPDVSELRGRFKFEINYKPVPDYGDFRVDLQEEELALLRQRVEQQTKDATEQVLRAPLERLREVVAKLNEVCKKDDRVVANARTGKEEVKPPIFRDSVVDNIAQEINLLYDFADIMPAEVQQLNSDIAHSLPDADVIRASSDARKNVAEKTDVLLDKINSMLEI
jgi:hypothetical protein